MYIHIYIYVYIYSSTHSFTYGLPEDMVYSSHAEHKILLFIHPTCDSLYLLIPHSHFIPSSLPFGNHKSVLYVCESVL